MLTVTSDGELSPGNAFLIQIAITTPDSATGNWKPATGLSTLAPAVASLPTNTPLSGITLTLSEYSGTPGTYELAGDGNAATLICTAIPGKRAYFSVTQSDALLGWITMTIARSRIVA